MKSAGFPFLLFTSFATIVFVSLLFISGCGQMASNAPPVATPTPGIANPNNFTYITVQGTSSLEGLRIDSSGTAVPIPGSPFKVPDTPLGLARSQQFLFAASLNFNFPATLEQGLITTFKIDPDTGSLTEVARQTAIFPTYLSVDAAGRFLYAAVRDGISVFSIGAGGQLTQVDAPSPGLDASLGQMFLRPDGRFLYAGGTPASGHTPSPGTVVANIDPASGKVVQGRFVVLAPRNIAETSDGAFLLATTTTPTVPNAICTYPLDPANGFPGGSFSTQVPQPAFCASTGLGSSGLAVTPAGSFVAVTNVGSNSISVFRMSSGMLTEVPGSPFAFAGARSQVAISRDGRFLLAGNSSNEVGVFRLDSSTGALTPIPGSPFPISGFASMILP